MSGKKVLLTYKRKQPSLTADPARENGKHNLPSGDQETDSQHFRGGKKLCSSCDTGRDSLDSLLNKKECRVKTEEGGEESNAEIVAVCLNESPQVNSCQSDPSVKDPCGQSLVHSSLESSLSQINKTDSAHHDSVVGIASQTLQISQCMARSYSNGPGREKRDFPRGNALIVATSNLEVDFSATEEKTTDILRDSLGEVKQPTPLLTFSRRRNRKRDVNGFDMSSKPSGKREGTSSNVSPHASNLVNDGGSIGDHTACPIPSGHSSDATAATDQMKGAGSMSARPGIEIEEVPNGEDVAVDASASTGPVLKQDSNATTIKEDLSIMRSQNDTIKDLHLEAKNDNQEAENSQSQPVIGDESLTASNEVAEGQPRANHVREVGVHFLDLSVAPSDTCEQKKGIDLNVSLENDSTNGSGRTLQDSLPYKNEVIDPSLQERSPSDASTVVCRRGEELGQIPEMRVLRDSCIAEDFNTKRDTGKSHVVLPTEVPCTRKCMQLFPDKRAEIALDSAVSLLEVADFRDSEAGEMLRLGTSNTCPEQLSGRHSFLGLSLPFAPRFGGCTHRNCSSIPFLSPENESRECMLPLLPSSSASQKSLLLRHKLMLDGILGRTRALNGHMAWSEEELDYLWIGVRRYGRSNWEAMLRDPRLHFSPFRMARDLAEQWEEEQVKLSGGPCSSQSKISRPQGIPAGYNCGLRRRGGASRRNPMDETRLSLGDLYANRKGTSVEDYHRFEQLRRSNSHTRRSLYEDYLTERYENSSFTSPFPSVAEANDGLPHWLREAHIPLPRLTDQTLASYHGSAQLARPYVDSDRPCLRRNNHPHAQNPLMQGVAEWGSSAPPRASKQNDFIIINSDSSSEETISDDNCVRA